MEGSQKEIKTRQKNGVRRMIIITMNEGKWRLEIENEEFVLKRFESLKKQMKKK